MTLDRDQAKTIVVAEGTPTASVKSAPTVTLPPSAAPTAHKLAPDKGGRLRPGQIAGIVVPIALVVLIPMIFLLWRSHQYRKATEKRQSQRSSQEPMLQRPSDLSTRLTPQGGALQQLNARSAPRNSNPSQPRPTNSLGLFNFDISPPNTPDMSAPVSPRSPGRLSIAHLMPVRRSQASVIEGKRPSTIRSNTDTRESQPSMLLEPPLRNLGPPSPTNPHFAPLNQIGVAHTRDTARPSLYRNPTSYDDDRRSRHSTDQLHASKMAEQPLRQPSPGLLPSIPHGGLNLSSRFTITDYLRSGKQTPTSKMAKSGHQTPASRLTRPQSHSSWHSDVSSLSDRASPREDSRHLNEVISPVKDYGGIQPYHIV